MDLITGENVLCRCKSKLNNFVASLVLIPKLEGIPFPADSTSFLLLLLVNGNFIRFVSLEDGDILLVLVFSTTTLAIDWNLLNSTKDEKVFHFKSRSTTTTKISQELFNINFKWALLRRRRRRPLTIVQVGEANEVDDTLESIKRAPAKEKEERRSGSAKKTKNAAVEIGCC